MAMLAGPRQKKRYILTPKGKPLFEDNDRFGTKMLEKMGWSKGKGLGKSENGQQDFVRLKFKADDQGFGFQERDDQWTEHEKNFNGLLENLNSGNNSSADNDDMTPAVGLGFATSNTSDKKKKLKEKISGQSLEERSKQSKARVHYKKFTKGKDMSQYSEKDLANIFGKKATPEDANIYDQFQAFNQRDEDVELPSGTPIINTGISVNDYFKSKMAALKEKQGIEVSLNPFGGNTRIKRKQSDDEEAPDVEEEHVPRKKKKTNHVEVEKSETAEPAAKSGEEQVPRKKKKSKKQSIEVEESNIVEETPESEEPPKKKKKDKKKKLELVTNIAEKIQNPVESNSEESNSSKKKKKSKKEIANEEIVETPCIPLEDQIQKTKKKKDKKDKSLPEEAKTEKVEESTSQNTAEEIHQQEETSKPIKSKKKKDKAEKNSAI
ncbi:PIN2/TERF1-interacting telomerase inhibitor 1 isoform X2 [Episyrphus balteatus]|uniref:PIN2/TERF1-interacting telomerase inhibitor 1 isoform X2 n=1 Tax=Episyrphus balteatus TaxID=286459 RepID=UPI00248550D3|nr:PIN2/TERF1-interacting telomerase inhibitor 1 isoform X2 [Episyrphus balteatus]